MIGSRPRIAVTGPLVPCDLIRAHGFEPVAPTLRACASGVGAAGVCAVAQGWADAVSADGAAFSAAVLTTRCDQLRRAAEALRDRLRVPLFVMNIPVTRGTPAAERLLEDERRRMDAFLSRVPPGQTGSPVAEKPEQPHAAVPDGYRVGLFGCCVTDADRTVLAMLDEVGLRVVFDATEHPQESRPFIGQRPNEAFFAWLDRRGRKARLAGWVLLRQPWCDLIHAEVFRLKRETGLPWLVLETGARPTLAALRTRAEAFAELLEQVKGNGDV